MPLDSTATVLGLACMFTPKASARRGASTRHNDDAVLHTSKASAMSTITVNLARKVHKNKKKTARSRYRSWYLDIFSVALYHMS